MRFAAAAVSLQQSTVTIIASSKVTHVRKLVQGGAVCGPGAKGVIIPSRHPTLLEPHPASLHAQCFFLQFSGGTIY